MRKSQKNPLVSCVIPTYNLKEQFLKTLASVVKQDYPNLEVIVIDNASTDGTYEATKKKFPQVRLYRNPKNLGVTGGVNAGIKRAKGDYIWLVDHDNVIKPNMLSIMVKLAQSDPKIGIVVPKIYFWEDKDIIWAAGTAINLWTGQIIFRTGKDVGQYEKVEEVQVAPANFLIKKEVIDKVGPYDNIYFATYEDTDFSFRARNAGYKIVYTPKAVCYHMIPFLDKREESERLLSRGYWIGRNRVIFMKRFGKNFLVFLLFLPVFTAYYAYLALRFQKLGDFLNFCKGTLEGLVLVVREKV